MVHVSPPFAVLNITLKPEGEKPTVQQCEALGQEMLPRKLMSEGIV
jgi:hypothetical protein